MGGRQSADGAVPRGLDPAEHVGCTRWQLQSVGLGVERRRHAPRHRCDAFHLADGAPQQQVRAGDRPTSLPFRAGSAARSEEHTSELQSLMRISYAVFCLKKNNREHIHVSVATKYYNILNKS